LKSLSASEEAPASLDRAEESVPGGLHILARDSEKDRGSVAAAQLSRGPSLRAIPFLKLAGSEPVELLSDAQQQELRRHAAVHVFPARKVVYRAGAPADSVFIIGDGVIKSFRDLPSGRRRIAAFFFPRDLFGLAEAGRYVNTVQTLTPMRAYQLDLQTLTELFRSQPGLELPFLCKTVHVLRESQHHNIIIGRRDAVGRVVMLLRLLQIQGRAGRWTADVRIPMTRSDIASYLSLSLEAVVRASGRLERDGIVEFVGRHQARIVDRERFDALASAV
jgi:CRP/FNR family transcriptional regulator, anaerobic regulatory protein